MRMTVAAGLAASLAVFGLSGCSAVSDTLGIDMGLGSNSLAQLNDARPSGTAFQRAQFKDYAYLARSFGDAPSGDEGQLADAYAAKALTAADGNDATPEEAASSDQRRYLDRLDRALDSGREHAPSRAARAQADYDCWVLNSQSDDLKSAARQCRTSLQSSLRQLENDAGSPSD